MPAGPVRRRLLVFAFLLTVITYLDRICISAAAPAITADLHLTMVQMGAVFSAFTLAYSLFEVPSGWLGDRRGQRGVLTRIVLWWSGFTMLTGAARGLSSLMAIRFLFGAGEAGAFPNLAGAFSQWFPARERGRATGIMMLGSRMGGVLSAPLALFVVARWGWRASFLAFGVPGLAWAAAWYAWHSNRPEDDPRVTPEELAWIRQDDPIGAVVPHATPWRAIFGSRNLYAICLMYFGYVYGLYFYFTWLPTYLITVLKFSTLSGGFFAALPFLLAGIANVAGGWTTDTLCRTRGLRVGRCGVGFCSYLASAAFVLLSTLPFPSVAKAVLLALALAASDFALGACWSAPVDIVPGHAGVMTGFMNSFGNVGGIVAPLVVGYAVDRWGSWTFPFYVTAVVYVWSALWWLAIDPTKPITEPTAVVRAAS